MTILFVPPSLRYFERLWGTAETIKFIAVTIVVSNIIAFGLSWIEDFVFQSQAFTYVWSLSTREERLTKFPSYGFQYHGQMALQNGLLVAFTQAIPEHQVQVFGVFGARVKVR